jgi:hypothetical protein
MDRPAHRSSAHVHTMLSFPPLTIVLLARLGACFQQLLYSPLQGHSFLRGPPWNGPRQNGSCFASLLQIAFDGRPRHLEEIHDLHSGDSFVNCAQHLLSQILWIGSHTPILSPGSIILQALVNKLPVYVSEGMSKYRFLCPFPAEREPSDVVFLSAVCESHRDRVYAPRAGQAPRIIPYQGCASCAEHPHVPGLDMRVAHWVGLHGKQLRCERR